MFLCGIWCDKISKIGTQDDDSQSTVSDKNEEANEKKTDSNHSSSSYHSEEKTQSVEIQNLKDLKEAKKPKKKQKVGNEEGLSQPSNEIEGKNTNTNVDYSREDNAHNQRRDTTKNAIDPEIQVEEEWTDTDSEAASNVRFDNYKLENNPDTLFQVNLLKKFVISI